MRFVYDAHVHPPGTAKTLTRLRRYQRTLIGARHQLGMKHTNPPATCCPHNLPVGAALVPTAQPGKPRIQNNRHHPHQPPAQLNTVTSATIGATPAEPGTMTIFETLTPEQQALIKRHLELVIEANTKVNLTRIDTIEDGMLLHVEDSLIGLEELNAAPAGEYGDLGSGGGYPGIPLAIATGRKTTLIDARQKKMLMLDDIINALGLSGQVETYAGRAELLAKTRSMRYAALTARALAKLPVLMELASPLLKKNGHLICYKAQMDDSELAHARRVQKATGMEYIGTRTLLLGENFTRKIVTFAKTTTPTIKLPRQEGQAQKNPL